MDLTPAHVRKSTLYIDRDIDKAFRALLTEQSVGLSQGVNIAMQDYLKKHGKKAPSTVRLRSQRLRDQGEEFVA